jgi:uncharacterized membrane protein YgcG
LLEVLLALMIGTLVLLALTTAINLQLKFTDVGRTDVEEAQLARAIFRQLADDLRGSVYPAPIEVEGADAAFKAAAEAAKKAASAASGDSGQPSGPTGSSGSGQSGGEAGDEGSAGEAPGGQSSGAGGATNFGGGATSGQAGSGLGASSLGGGGSSAGGLGATSGSGTSGTSGTGDGTSSDSTTTTLLTGLYGDAYQLQFDLARVPRPDEWTALPAGAAAGLAAAVQPGLDRTSEVKTVSYLLLTSSPLAGGTAVGTSSLPPAAAGLVRTEMDRATAAYARTGASLNVSTGKTELLAPEVTALGFRYFDGTSWYESWDSMTRQGLPQAVEIQLGVRRSRTRSGSAEEVPVATVAGAAPVEEALVYRLVVQIPGARSSAVTQLEFEQESAESSDSGTSGSGSLGSGSSGLGSGSGSLGSGR